MASIFVSGSADGLGLLAAQRLLDQGHEVTLHARNEARAADARRAAPRAHAVVVGDVATIAGVRTVAGQANALGRFDAVIHNVGIMGRGGSARRETPDGLSMVFAVNVLAPYLLTALMPQPRRLVYLSSGLHRSGTPNLEDPQWRQRRWDATQAYADSKLLDVVLAFAVARRWPSVLSNALEPGWVPTRMGGPHAPDDLALGSLTQAWLAVSEDPAATVSGQYFRYQKPQPVHPAARDPGLQEALLDYCAGLSGVPLP